MIFSAAATFGLEIARAILDVRNGAAERKRVQADRVDRLRLFDRFLRGFAIAAIELELGQQHVRPDGRRIRVDDRLTSFSASGRILVEDGLREPKLRRHVMLVSLQRVGEGFHGFRVVVRLQEQLAPPGLNSRHCPARVPVAI